MSLADLSVGERGLSPDTEPERVGGGLSPVPHVIEEHQFAVLVLSPRSNIRKKGDEQFSLTVRNPPVWGNVVLKSGGVIFAAPCRGREVTIVEEVLGSSHWIYQKLSNNYRINLMGREAAIREVLDKLHRETGPFEKPDELIQEFDEWVCGTQHDVFQPSTDYLSPENIFQEDQCILPPVIDAFFSWVASEYPEYDLHKPATSTAISEQYS
jgi:hypothetical protein